MASFLTIFLTVAFFCFAAQVIRYTLYFVWNSHFYIKVLIACAKQKPIYGLIHISYPKLGPTSSKGASHAFDRP